MSEFSAVMPHGDLEEVFPGVFFVTGSVSMQNGAMTFSRNMIVLREGSELTLINTVRLNEAGLEALDALGRVKHIVKIGAYHKMDDAFYVNRYSPKLWAMAGMDLPEGSSIDEELRVGVALPIPDATFFPFATSKTPEGLLLLAREGGVLIACDSLQNWRAPDQYFNEAAATNMGQWGFIKPANVGPGWLKAGAPQASDFAQVTALSFKHLLSGHGEPLRNDAHAQLSATFERLFPA